MEDKKEVYLTLDFNNEYEQHEIERNLERNYDIFYNNKNENDESGWIEVY